MTTSQIGISFRHKVLSFLTPAGLLDDERIELLDSWRSGHTGFSVHNAVTVRSVCTERLIQPRSACLPRNPTPYP